MSILNKLARSQGTRGDEANIELAKEISATNNKGAVDELVENIGNKNKKLQSDCIKTLYETAERNPALVADHYNIFVNLLESKNPRLVWGATCALSAITLEKPKQLYEAIPKILDAVEKSQSVIARDHAVEILSKLGTVTKYNEDVFQLLMEIIAGAPVNQLAAYAEHTAPIVSNKNKSIFKELLISRLPDLNEYPAKIKRIEKVLKRLEK